MKKKIEKELTDLAERILEPSGSRSIGELKEEARGLYEKLVLLTFTENQLSEKQEAKDVTFAEHREPVAKKEKEGQFQGDEFAPDGTQYRKGEAITEPATEKIKDIVAQMPPETASIDRLFEEEPSQSSPEEIPGNGDFRQIGVDYDNLPDFEPLNKKQQQSRPKSLNDRLKRGIDIGLNERLSYIKHLFDGNTADYNRVLSQLNTISSLEEARKFIDKIVKPDYNNWEGKEIYEERFMEKIENRYGH